MTIIHTGDFHNKLGDADAERLAAIRDAHPGALMLDAGDAVGAGNLGFRPGGEPILERMSGLGYAAMTMGNREAHVWRNIVEMKVKSARFPVLSANLTLREPLERVRPYITTEVDGIRVGVVGLTVPMITRTMWSRHLADLIFENPHEIAARLAAELRPNVDLLILLSHLGVKEDRRLAETGDFDLILGGHSHVLTETPERIGNTWLCHTGSHARFAGIWNAARAADGWTVTGGLEPLRKAA
jgi:2',3'-cyclic-nucleotide 2'-phosphodiesterase (5'-nucleotidase family)